VSSGSRRNVISLASRRDCLSEVYGRDGGAAEMTDAGAGHPSRLGGGVQGQKLRPSVAFSLNSMPRPAPIRNVLDSGFSPPPMIPRRTKYPRLAANSGTRALAQILGPAQLLAPAGIPKPAYRYPWPADNGCSGSLTTRLENARGEVCQLGPLDPDLPPPWAYVKHSRMHERTYNRNAHPLDGPAEQALWRRAGAAAVSGEPTIREAQWLALTSIPKGYGAPDATGAVSRYETLSGQDETRGGHHTRALFQLIGPTSLQQPRAAGAATQPALRYTVARRAKLGPPPRTPGQRPRKFWVFWAGAGRACPRENSRVATLWGSGGSLPMGRRTTSA